MRTIKHYRTCKKPDSKKHVEIIPGDGTYEVHQCIACGAYITVPTAHAKKSFDITGIKITRWNAWDFDDLLK